MQVLNYNNKAKSLEPTKELCQAIRILSGESFSRQIPISVIDWGTQKDETYKYVKAKYKCLDDGTIDPSIEPVRESWSETIEAKPLRIRQGNLKASIVWKDLETFVYDDTIEQEYEAKQAKSKPKTENSILKKLASLDEDKLAKLLELL